MEQAGQGRVGRELVGQGAGTPRGCWVFRVPSGEQLCGRWVPLASPTPGSGHSTRTTHPFTMIRVWTHQEDPVLMAGAPNYRASKYMENKLTENP